MTAAGAALGAPVACMYCSVRVDKENVGGIGLFFPSPVGDAPPLFLLALLCSSRGVWYSPLVARRSPAAAETGGRWVGAGRRGLPHPPPSYTYSTSTVRPPTPHRAPVADPQKPGPARPAAIVLRTLRCRCGTRAAAGARKTHSPLARYTELQ